MPVFTSRPRRAAVALLSVSVLFLSAIPSLAVISAPIPLKTVIREEMIFTASVEKVEPDKPGVVFKFGEKIKGEIPFERIPVNMTGDAEAKKLKHTQILLERLDPSRTLLFFISKEDKIYNAMAFTEGTWFSIRGTTDDDGKTVRWALLHGEPNLRGTFKGTTAELKKLVQDGLAKKIEFPAVNEKEPPGFGPPVETKKKGDEPSSTSKSTHMVPRTSIALFGVIPSFVLVGPLAIIAALFPGVFARMAVGMKRWRAFLVVASANSTLALLYYFLRSYLPDSTLTSPRALSLLLLTSTTIGLFWAGRRYRKMAGEQPNITGTPTRTELLALAVMSLATGLIVASTRFFGQWNMAIELPMREFTCIAAGLLAATLYATYRTVSAASDHLPDGSQPAVRLSLSGEAVGLWMLFLCGLAILLSSGDNGDSIAIGTQAGEGEAAGPHLVSEPRVFKVPDLDQVMTGMAVDGGRIYFGASKIKLSSQKGYVLSLNGETGSVIWKFAADFDLKPLFSTPVIAAGKLYCGEGLHKDSGCRFFCLDAETGKSAWAKPFETSSHTEGTPRVVNGKVYFTAGNDGLYCADAATGEKKWQFDGQAKGFHIDGPPAVAGGRVFIGSGLYTRALMALDAETGKELWRMPIELRSFGAVLAFGDRVFYGLGTGNLTADIENYDEEKESEKEQTPAGAVVCLEASTGKEVWKYDLTRSVHTPLTADAFSIYATSRDGCVHCLNRKSGQLRWKTTIGRAITAGAALATANRLPVAVYAVSQEGNVACLNPHTGQAVWSRQLPGFHWNGNAADGVLSTPTVISTETPTTSKRTIYIGGMLMTKNTEAKSCAVFRFDDEIGE